MHLVPTIISPSFYISVPGTPHTSPSPSSYMRPHAHSPRTAPAPETSLAAPPCTPVRMPAHPPFPCTPCHPSTHPFVSYFVFIILIFFDAPTIILFPSQTPANLYPSATRYIVEAQPNNYGGKTAGTISAGNSRLSTEKRGGPCFYVAIICNNRYTTRGAQMLRRNLPSANSGGYERGGRINKMTGSLEQGDSVNSFYLPLFSSASACFSLSLFAFLVLRSLVSVFPSFLRSRLSRLFFSWPDWSLFYSCILYCSGVCIARAREYICIYGDSKKAPGG